MADMMRKMGGEFGTIQDVRRWIQVVRVVEVNGLEEKTGLEGNFLEGNSD